MNPLKSLLFLSLFFSGISISCQGQNKDTLIIIRFGDSQLYSQALSGNVKSINAGTNFLNILDEQGHLSTWTDLNAYYIETPVIQEKLTDIRSGDIHTVVLYSDSTLNQFFVVSGIRMFYPSRFRSVVSVASGPKMSVAINKKNIMYTWGPLNTVTDLQIPIKTYGVKVAAVGKHHVAFINIKNKVFVWGDHSGGKNNIPAFKSTPVKITAGYQHSMVLDKEGSVYAWGNNLLGQCNVPTFTAKAVQIDAKINRSMALLENQELHIWGMNEHLTLNYSALGTVKQAVLGNNYVAILVSSNPQKMEAFHKPEVKVENTALFSESDKSDSLMLMAKDSLLRSMMIPTDSNFIARYMAANYEDASFHQDDKGNIINFESDASYFEHVNSSVDIRFEGEGNEVTVINNGINSRRTNVKQTVIIKGSGKKITINNSSEDLSNEEYTTVIDLDKYGEDNVYPEEYTDKVQDQQIDPHAIEFIDFQSLPNTLITEMPVSDGEYWANSQYVSEANDCETILFEANIWEDSFESAQAYFHCKQPAKAMQRLIESDPLDCSRCKLALFEIYYYGLFGYSPDLIKANMYYNEYLKSR